MKKIIITAFAGLVANISVAQTTAQNFTANDCSGATHDLFTELDAGKVIVMVWVMPCGNCIGPSLSALNEIQNYSSTYPNRIKLYIADDDGGTNCSSLNNWVNTNGLAAVNNTFSDANIDENYYGAPGMPKIVVMGGGTAHKVFFNQNNGLNVTNFNAAIQQALTTGISENTKADFQLSVFPNPSINKTITLSYNLLTQNQVTISIYNTLGDVVKSISAEKRIGKQETSINTESLTKGIYFVRLNAGELSETIKFTVAQ